uniref:Uncharacterized protein n=1 Tax=Arundo donax TaxID=35708 RepID=A0A0A9H1A5_ARUDO
MPGCGTTGRKPRRRESAGAAVLDLARRQRAERWPGTHNGDTLTRTVTVLGAQDSGSETSEERSISMVGRGPGKLCSFFCYIYGLSWAKSTGYAMAQPAYPVDPPLRSRAGCCSRAPAPGCDL